MGWQIAIDGPAGSGKSTVAKQIAKQLNFKYLDTGAMYRAVALKGLNLGINLENEDEYRFLEDTKIDFQGERIFLDGVDVSSEIRSVEVSKLASLVAKFPYVRDMLVKEQQAIASDENVVMDGRDIGTVVLKDANLKVFLTASVEERAQRRLAERREKGLDSPDLATTIKEISERDYQDSHREVGPLKQADDAIYLDSSDLCIEAVIEKIISLVLERGYRMENLEQKNEILEEVKEAEASETETSTEENKEEAAKYHELQIVTGTVVEVIPAQPARKVGNKEFKAREEKVLIELEDGQEGYLSKKDTVGLADDEELFDAFLEGDKVEVAIKKIFPDGGKFVFSTALVAKKKELEKFEEIVKERPIIKVKVVKNAPIGLLTKYEDFSCLIPKKPKSLLNIPEEELDALAGQEIEVVPVRVDYARIRIIASQAAADAQKAKSAKKAFVEQLEVGQVYDGVVKNIEKYGAFVELGNGVEGLLHISELAHDRVFKVEKVLNVGDSVKVQVIKLEKDHIGLSRKALMPNHWADYTEGKEVGTVACGKVVDIRDAGVTVELAEEINGFLPKSEFSWNNDAVIAEEVKVGDELEAKIIEIDNSKKRIILSKKQLTENPWLALTCKAGDLIDVVVAKELEQGFKVTYQGVNGYLSKGSIRNHENEVKVGAELKVKVRALDTQKSRLVVNLNDAEEKIEKENYSKYMKAQDKISNTLGDYFANLKNRK